MIKNIVKIAVVAVLVGCAPNSNINKTIDRTEKEIIITVKFYENRIQLEDAYREANNLGKNVEIPEQWGFAQWNSWRNAAGEYIDLPGEEYRCDIHTFRPKRIDDQAVVTLGHELLHCIYGSYHN